MKPNSLPLAKTPHSPMPVELVSSMQLSINRPLWEISEQRFISSATVGIPYGCIDWRGTKEKANLDRCVFCPLPRAVWEVEEYWNENKRFSPDQLQQLFNAALSETLARTDTHTLNLFNAGSFLAMPHQLQEHIMKTVAEQLSIQRVVIESRAKLITKQNLTRLMNILTPVKKNLTIRLGIETHDESFRLEKLGKSDTNQEILDSVLLLHSYGIRAGAYVMLNPYFMQPEKAVVETCKTFGWIFDSVCFDEAYFCSTNIGAGTKLYYQWQQGLFEPASLWMVLKALQYGVNKYGKIIHLLPFEDTPSFERVPSNHIREGIPEDLSGAQGCDLAFHNLFNQYRTSMDQSVLQNPPACDCRPQWW
jgi:radical SAM enzyme (TIGR01210 family)